MKSIKEVLNIEICDHSLKLLQAVISSIESYPDLYKVSKIDNLNTSELSDKEVKKQINLIKEEVKIKRQKLATSNVKIIKDLLSKIELKLKYLSNKSDQINLDARINYLNNHTISAVFSLEKKEQIKELKELKKQLKKELQSVDKTLAFYAKLYTTDGKIVIEENLKIENNFENLFQLKSIEKLVDDINLEEDYQQYYQQLSPKAINSTYKNIYLPTESNKLKKLRQIKYPNLKILSKLIKIDISTDNKKLEEKCIETADLVIKKAQLQDLSSYMQNNNFKLTKKYIEMEIHLLTKKIKENNYQIEQAIERKISKIDFKNIIINDNKNRQDAINLLKEILKQTEKKAKTTFNFNSGNLTYREIIIDDLQKFQENLLRDDYNINLSLQEIYELFNIEFEDKNKDNNKLMKILKKIRRK